MTGPRPTATDVAALAGVSRSTVSYILNGSGQRTFAPETVARVHAAASQLAYAPQPAARALRRGKSGVVLLPLPDLPASTNFAKLVSALTDAVRATGRSMANLALRPDNRLGDILRDISPAALVEVLPLSEEDRSTARAAGVPILSVVEPILVLDHAGAAAQVQHLATLGHRRIAVLTARERSMHEFAQARLVGATEAASALDLPAPDVEELSGPPADALTRLAARIRTWVNALTPVTAVCCFNDLLAAAITAAATKAGLRVPEDLSVIGMDDEPLGGMLNPTLTTVRFDYAAVSLGLRERLRHDLDGYPLPRSEVPGTVELLVRESTTTPSRRHKRG